MRNFLPGLKKMEMKMYFISTIFFILLIISALIVYYHTKREEKNFFDIVGKHTLEIFEKVKPDLVSYLSGRSDLDNDIHDKIIKNREVSFFRILDKNNQIISSSVPSEIKDISDNAEIQEVDLSKRSFTRMFTDNKSNKIYELTTPIFSENKNKMIGKMVLGISMDEIHLVVNAGRYKNIALGFSLFMLGGAGILFNISYFSYRSVQNALENVKSYTNSILLSMDLGVISTDLDGKISIVNNAAKYILDVDRLIGENIFNIFEEQQELAKIFKETLQNNRGMKTTEVQYKKNKRDKHLRITTSILKNNENKVIGIVVLVEDVTEIKELEKRVYRSDKVSSLGRLAAGIAHEIKNPLSAMNINVQLVEEELVNNSDIKKIQRDKLLQYINVINSETSRLEGIINNFSDFTKIDKLKKEMVSIEMILEQVINLISPEAKRRNVIIKKNIFSRPGRLVFCDRNKIKQLLLNLFINSLQAMSAGGELVITFFETPELFSIEVEDTGVGIKKEDQVKIFDLYYTTKQSGSGLGLSICQKIVEDHNGTLELMSEYGSKTKFTINLPFMNEGESVNREIG